MYYDGIEVQEKVGTEESGIWMYVCRGCVYTGAAQSGIWLQYPYIQLWVEEGGAYLSVYGHTIPIWTAGTQSKYNTRFKYIPASRNWCRCSGE